MRILVVSSYLPYPLTSGGHVRLFNIIKNLSKGNGIVLVCEKRDFQKKEDIEALEKICEKVIWVRREKQWSLKNVLKSVFSNIPFLIVGHTNKKMQEKIKNLLESEKFDLIHVETSYVFQNLPQDIKIPTVLVEHNIEYMVYKRYADGKPFPLKNLLYMDISKLKKWEERFWNKAAAIVAVSKQDKDIIGKKNTFVIPNGVDIGSYSKTDTEKLILNDKVLFIGDFKWIQNRDAAEFILKDIWSNLIKDSKFKTKNYYLWIVGREIPDYLKKLGGENVLFDENAPSDTYEIYKKSKILLAPIRVGGGTSFKILEAMASGVPVVTTHLGASGIGASKRKEVMIGESAHEFQKAVEELLEDKDLYKKISNNARKLIEDKYSWDRIIGDLEDVYERVLNA